MRMKFAKGLITGSAIGAVVGMMVLPKLNNNTRKEITVTSRNMTDNTADNTNITVE